MKELTINELELRKWALEISLNHCNKLFPQHYYKTPSEIVSNARKIADLVCYNWDNEFIDNCERDGSPTLRSNP
jgi:hypothetical protein